MLSPKISREFWKIAEYPPHQLIRLGRLEPANLKIDVRILAQTVAIVITWDQALFSFRFENYIPAGKDSAVAVRENV